MEPSSGWLSCLTKRQPEHLEAEETEIPNFDRIDESSGDKCADWLCAALADAGATVVYSSKSLANSDFIRAICGHSKVSWVGVNDASSAAMMASAYSQLYPEKLGVCFSDTSVDSLIPIMEQSTSISVLLLTTNAISSSSSSSSRALYQSTCIQSASDLPTSLRAAVATSLTRGVIVHLSLPTATFTTNMPVYKQIKHGGFGEAGVTGVLQFSDSQLSRFKPAQPWFTSSPTDVAARLRRINPDLAFTPTTAEGHILPPRVVVVVGQRAIGAGEQIERLAEALRAPIVTRLDALGVIDSAHPLAIGAVRALHQPGLEASRALLSTVELVVTIGCSEGESNSVHDDAISACCRNRDGIQVRPVIEIDVDVNSLNPRISAEHTIVGLIPASCTAIADIVERRLPQNAAISLETRASTTCDGCLSPARKESNSDASRRFYAKADELWYLLHRGNWRRLRGLARPRFSYIPAPPKTPKKKATPATEDGDSDDEFLFGDEKIINSNFVHPSIVLRALTSKLDVSCTLVVGSIDFDISKWVALNADTRRGAKTLVPMMVGGSLCSGVVAALSEPTKTPIVCCSSTEFEASLSMLAALQEYREAVNKLIVLVFDDRVKATTNLFTVAEAFGCVVVEAKDNAQAEAAVNGAFVESLNGVYVILSRIDPDLSIRNTIFNDRIASICD